ncbi:MAG TPA: c-type cytochrome [Candidatus Eisenbacteria bacterium]|nr:c-type cytochrome [Candidatus Eisenbacteria bacterium]
MNVRTTRRLAVTFLLAAVLASGAAAFVDAQIPQTFKNLRVLPKDIARPALIGEMREMAGALGVRCGHCHPGGNPETLQGVDFASDSLESKRVARTMIRMTREINSAFLPMTGRDTMRMARVRCVTCHHGARRPETLADTLHRALDRGGAPMVTAAYRSLREQYYGRAVYDFGEGALWFMAEQATRKAATAEAAIPLLELNLEFFPKSVNTRIALGDRLIANGDTAAAIRRWHEALELEPGNRFIQSKLDAVRGGKR